MDIYTYLKNDHKKVSQLFSKLINSKSSALRKNIYEKIKQELTLHADTENATFYQALRNNPSSKDNAIHGKKEHDEIKKFLRKLDTISAKSVKWLVQLGELKHTVEHHVDDEEKEMFKAAKKVISKDEAQDLAVEMDNLKKKKMGIKIPKTKTTFTERMVQKIDHIFK